MDKADLYDVLTAELRTRVTDSKTRRHLNEYELGYADALGELLEYVEDGEIAVTTPEVAS